MNQAQRWAIVGGVVAVVLMGLIPPWEGTEAVLRGSAGKIIRGSVKGVHAGYVPMWKSAVIEIPGGYGYSSIATFKTKVNIRLLLVQWVGVVIVTSGLVRRRHGVQVFEAEIPSGHDPQRSKSYREAADEIVSRLAIMQSTLRPASHVGPHGGPDAVI